MDWKNRFESEIQRAAAVRDSGNAGQSRVCARRAAGIAIREYYQRRNISVKSSSAYDLIKSLQELTDLPDGVLRDAEYLVLRVDQDFNLPLPVDLVLVAQRLAACLLPDADMR